MLADRAPGSVGNAWFLYIGPAVIFLAVVAWVLVTLTASRVGPRRRTPGGGLPNRGPVQGGIIQGSPSQRSRRDPAPSVTHREVMADVEADVEYERAREEAERAAAPAGARRKRRRGLFGSHRGR
ncbi:hypothetical protein [Actinomadura chokoriensis]|uniref:Uncharacterized protein n=1 Tax=Actinomadura chokoriensis TaxID=454156 RepID=A0ABV4R9A2_9ACTN